LIDAQDDDGIPSPDEQINCDDNEDDGDDGFLGGPSTSTSLSLVHPKPLPKYSIFTIVYAIEFLGPSECY
jgi:hypothetical protein